MKDEDKDIDTLFAIRLPRQSFIRDILILLFGGLLFAIGFAAFGALQFTVCRFENPDISLARCFRVPSLSDNHPHH